VWRRELSGSETFVSLAVDPLDCRRLCLCGSQGALAVLRLRDTDADDVELRQYRVAVGGAPLARWAGGGRWRGACWRAAGRGAGGAGGVVVLAGLG
jgi:hypothetical protein